MKQSQIVDFHKRLRHWYGMHGRKDLPWRNTRDPYHIYLSEVMLQQTQVKTVLERYYHPFLKRFPTLSSLAQAKRAKVLKAWEGLGYYTRAANLHEAAKRSAPALPQTVDALMALPGIGRNTAHAIAAFAYRQPVPVMEANLKRVLCRIFAIRQPNDALLWEKAHALLDSKNPFDYNQAMMDIGATVCTKRGTACSTCPATSICSGKTAPHLYPTPKTKKQPPLRKKTIVVFTHGKNYVVQQRTSKFLQGLYGFMEYEADISDILFQKRMYKLHKKHHIGSITQSYSHFTLQAEVYKLPLAAAPAGTCYGLQALAKLPLSRADSKILQLLS